MTVDTVDLEQALRLLSQPRVVGNHPEDGEPITAQNGRYGPYLVHVKETRSPPNEEAIFDIELPEAPPCSPSRSSAVVELPTRASRSADRSQQRWRNPAKVRPFRPIRDGRRDQRPPAQGGRSRNDHAGSCGGTTGRTTAGRRAAEETKSRRPKAAAKKATRRRRQRPPRRRQRRRPRTPGKEGVWRRAVAPPRRPTGDSTAAAGGQWCATGSSSCSRAARVPASPPRWPRWHGNSAPGS